MDDYYDTDYPGRIYCEFEDGKVAIGWSETLQMYVCEDHMPYQDRILA